jgi:Domain of unknown function (DUF4276)
MRGIYVMCEGATEVQFVENSLRHHFFAHGIYDIRGIDYMGALSYQKYKNDIVRLLKHERDIIVTSLIDFYALRTDFPGYDAKTRLADPNAQVAHIEQKIHEDLEMHPRFVPYIQLHEFEGLLFTDMRGFQQVPECTDEILATLQGIVDAFPNPELINDSPLTAPSKRLLQHIPGYQKPLYGAYIALENGLNLILDRCPRFRAWVSRLEIEVMKP